MSIKLTVDARPALCTDQEASRYILSAAQAFPRKGGAWIVATDGRRLSVTKAEGTCDEHCMIPGAILAHDKNRHTVERDAGLWFSGDGRYSQPAPDGKWPNWTKVFDDVSAKGRLAIGLNVKLLHELSMACQDRDGDGVTLFIDPANTDAVYGVACGDSIGLICGLDIEAEKNAERFDATKDELLADYRRVFPAAPEPVPPSKRATPRPKRRAAKKALKKKPAKRK